MSVKTKTDLIQTIYETPVATGTNNQYLTKESAERIANACISFIENSLQEENDKIVIVGLGTFEMKKSAARIGKNIQTGEKIQIPEKLRIKFKESPSLNKKRNK